MFYDLISSQPPARTVLYHFVYPEKPTSERNFDSPQLKMKLNWSKLIRKRSPESFPGSWSGKEQNVSDANRQILGFNLVYANRRLDSG